MVFLKVFWQISTSQYR